MTDVDLPPDRFLYGRQGPWPQPSPSHPLIEAPEVLTIPPIEQMEWQATIGQRYLLTQSTYPALAARAAVNALETPAAPDDATFASYLFDTAFQRYLLPLADADTAQLRGAGIDPAGLTKYDFGAMDLVRPLAGLYCAPTRVFIAGQPGSQSVRCIGVGDEVVVTPTDAAWGLAKIFALQGAAYHILFVVHPALHFPMDSVNAVTKTAVPRNHPLFQLIQPHTTYTLALDNAVLEGASSVVNDDPEGTWFDPLTSDAYNLKLLFAAGYTGLDDPGHRGAYPAYDYMQPPLLGYAGSPQPLHQTRYSAWHTAFFDKAFLPFCTTVAKQILQTDPNDPYVSRWARYLNVNVKGFPTEEEILDADVLGRALAIYVWDVTLAHGADHASFGQKVLVPHKYLRSRVPPPGSRTDASPQKMSEVATGDDLMRSEMANQMFFLPWTMYPNLIDTGYAFTDPVLAKAQDTFHNALGQVERSSGGHGFMSLHADPKDEAAYALTVPASIQY